LPAEPSAPPPHTAFALVDCSGVGFFGSGYVFLELALRILDGVFFNLLGRANGAVVGLFGFYLFCLVSLLQLSQGFLVLWILAVTVATSGVIGRL
jgi:hypothetical protein